MRQIPTISLMSFSILFAGCGGLSGPTESGPTAVTCCELPPKSVTDSAMGILLPFSAPRRLNYDNASAFSAVGWTRDARTMYVVSAQSYMQMFDMASLVNTPPPLSLGVSGFQALRIGPGSDFLFSVFGGTIRRGSRDRTTIDDTPVTDGGSSDFAVSPDGRFIVHAKLSSSGQSTGQTEVVDLLNGDIRRVPSVSGVLLAVSDGGNEVALKIYGQPTDSIAVVTLSSGSVRKFGFSLGGGVETRIYQAAWVGDTLFAVGQDLLLPSKEVQLREFAPDIGRASVLGRIPQGYFPVPIVDWAPIAHRAVAIMTTHCYGKGFDCTYAYSVSVLQGGVTTRVAKFAAKQLVTDMSISPDGRWLVYAGDSFMLKALP